MEFDTYRAPSRRSVCRCFIFLWQ